jgi:hypothetical protein
MTGLDALTAACLDDPDDEGRLLSLTGRLGRRPGARGPSTSAGSQAEEGVAQEGGLGTPAGAARPTATASALDSAAGTGQHATGRPEGIAAERTIP